MEIMKIVEHYPTSISEDDNNDLMQSVTLAEIRSVLALAKNNKILGPDDSSGSL